MHPLSVCGTPDAAGKGLTTLLHHLQALIAEDGYLRVLSVVACTRRDAPPNEQ